jgi:hypothetical protein
MRSFSTDPISSGSEEPGTWALNLPGLWVNGFPVQLKGGLPSYHPVIHFVGYAGITRTALAAFGPCSMAASVGIYAGCIVLAMITGKLVQRAKSDRLPRICSALLGMTGFIAGMLGAQIGTQHKATHSLAELAVPLGAVGFMIVVTGIGEVLARWAPRKALPGSH